MMLNTALHNFDMPQSGFGRELTKTKKDTTQIIKDLFDDKACVSRRALRDRFSAKDTKLVMRRLNGMKLSEPEKKRAESLMDEILNACE